MVDKELSKQGMTKYYSTKIARQTGKIAVKVLFRKKIPFEKKEIKTILFIQLYGIGDYLMSTGSAVLNGIGAVLYVAAVGNLIKPFFAHQFRKKAADMVDTLHELSDIKGGPAKAFHKILGKRYPEMRKIVESYTIGHK